jgi:SAM-dependent methyltransferase
MTKQMDLPQLLRALPANAKVLDVGCFGYGLHRACTNAGRTDLENHGVDYSESEEKPAGFLFKKIDLNRDPLPYGEGTFDLVLAAHVIEHVRDGVGFFIECSRVLKPGGCLVLFCPSERSLSLSGMPFRHDLFCSLSFFDDPTHLGRPYSPQSLFRLAKYTNLEPEACGYDRSFVIWLLYPLLYLIAYISRDAVLLERVVWQAKGWASFLIARKQSAPDAPPFRYYIPYRRSPLLHLRQAILRRFR